MEWFEWAVPGLGLPIENKTAIYGFMRHGFLENVT